MNKAFHPFGLAVCTNEKTQDFEFIFQSLQIGLEKINKPRLVPIALVSDAAAAIKNAFKNTFANENELVTCWSHMKRKIDTKVSMISDQSLQEEIISDIQLLQLCNSIELFDKALRLFERK